MDSNKVSRTILKAAFLSVAFVLTGKFVVSAFAMLLLVFMTDFAKIALATDQVRWSRKPETWNIGNFIGTSVVLGVTMVAETLFLLHMAWSRFGLVTGDFDLLGCWFRHCSWDPGRARFGLWSSDANFKIFRWMLVFPAGDFRSGRHVSGSTAERGLPHEGGYFCRRDICSGRHRGFGSA